MRRRLHLLAAILLNVLFLLFASCGGDEETDDGGSNCSIGDPVEGRDCECTGTSCVCPSSGDCAIACASECSLQCAGSGNCDFACPQGCATECTGSGNCAVAVGEASQV